MKKSETKYNLDLVWKAYRRLGVREERGDIPDDEGVGDIGHDTSLGEGVLILLLPRR